MLNKISWLAKLIAQGAMRVGIRLLLIVLFTSGLVCFAPGFDSDEGQLDIRYDTTTILGMRQSRSQKRNPARTFLGYVCNLTRGELGRSETFKRPVSELLSERLPVTLRMVAVGGFYGWGLAIVLASATALLRSRTLEMVGGFLAGSLLCAPSVLLAFAAVAFRAPVCIAMCCVVFARVFLTLNTFFMASALKPHVMAADAMGMSRSSLFKWHIVGVNVPQIITLTAGSILTALAAAVPIEVISDSPGLGQLAWKATLGRDLPLLLGVTLLIACANSVVAVAMDMVNAQLRERTA